MRGLVTRIATRAIFAVVASIFVLGALTFGHIAAWYGIRVGLEQSFLVTAGILGGVDLLVAVTLLVLASRSSPSRTETEALEVRRRALEGIGSALSLTQMVLPVLRLASGLRRRRRV